MITESFRDLQVEHFQRYAAHAQGRLKEIFHVKVPIPVAPGAFREVRCRGPATPEVLFTQIYPSGAVPDVLEGFPPQVAEHKRIAVRADQVIAEPDPSIVGDIAPVPGVETCLLARVRRKALDERGRQTNLHPPPLALHAEAFQGILQNTRPGTRQAQR